ncbi:MAG: hypothetical protein VR67_18735 [Peptococcaceae bacterium BRH_c8a]|nr:MAG: hypothetical protein VR67_18735 [Peptococcaceae bacterium BRH_c8a]
MPVISPEMKKMVEQNQCFIATADQAGNPSVAPKGSTRVISDNIIAFAEIVGRRTYRNILENPRAAIVVADRETLSGYRFFGKVELVTSGPIYDLYVESLNRMNMPNPIAVVQILVDEIYDMSVKNPGGRIE